MARGARRLASAASTREARSSRNSIGPRRHGLRGEQRREKPDDVDEHGHVGELRILARGGLVRLVGSIVSGALGVGFVAFIGRTLSVRQAGGLFEAIAIFSMFSYTTVLGADWGLLKFMPTFQRPMHRQVLSIVSIGPALLVSAGIAAGIFLEATGIARLVI